MKFKSIFRGSAIAFTALLSCSLTLSAGSSSAEPLFSQAQQQTQKQNPSNLENSEAASNDTVQPENAGKTTASVTVEAAFEVPPTSYLATAYSLRGRTASGVPVSKGLIAADPRFLPLGSRVKLEAGNYSGEYLVADTGGSVRGKRIDIWTPTSREALRFGKRVIKLTVLSYGGKRKAARMTSTQNKTR